MEEIKENFDLREEQQNNKIIANLKLQMIEIIRTDMSAYDRITEFIKKIKENHSDYLDYSFYHALAGSTPKETLHKDDFPGEYSIETFIGNLYQEVVEKKLTSNETNQSV